MDLEILFRKRYANPKVAAEIGLQGRLEEGGRKPFRTQL